MGIYCPIDLIRLIARLETIRKVSGPIFPLPLLVLL